MPPAHTALAASIVLSALGVVIICALTAFYGFTPEGEEQAAQANRSAAAATPREQAPPPLKGLVEKFRNDWRAIQRGWENAGEDFRRATAPLRGDN